MTVLRRCVDIGDVLAIATTGQAAVAIVSADLRRLDTEAVTRLRASGVAVVGVHPAADQRARARLERIGITALVPDDAGTELVLTAARGRGDRPGRLARAGPRSVRPAGGAAAARSGGRRRGAGRPARAAGRVVAVWGPTGAPGRTTVATCLAVESAQLGTADPADRRRRLRRGGGLRVRAARRVARAGRGLPAGGQRPAGPGLADLAVLVARRRPAAAHRHRQGRSVAGGPAVGHPRGAGRRQGDGAADRRRLRLRDRGRRGDQLRHHGAAAQRRHPGRAGRRRRGARRRLLRPGRSRDG